MMTTAIVERVLLLQSAFDATLRIDMEHSGQVVETSTAADRLFMKGMQGPKSSKGSCYWFFWPF